MINIITTLHSFLSFNLRFVLIFIGGDGEKDLDDEEQAEKLHKPDLGRLDKFVRNAGQVGIVL